MPYVLDLAVIYSSTSALFSIIHCENWRENIHANCISWHISWLSIFYYR